MMVNLRSLGGSMLLVRGYKSRMLVCQQGSDGKARGFLGIGRLHGTGKNEMIPIYYLIALQPLLL